jgi:hypothetical protein
MRSVIRLGVSSSGHNTEHILQSARRARRWTSWISDTTSRPNELNSDIDHPVSMTVYKMQKLAPRTFRVFSTIPIKQFTLTEKGLLYFLALILRRRQLGLQILYLPGLFGNLLLQLGIFLEMVWSYAQSCLMLWCCVLLIILRCIQIFLELFDYSGCQKNELFGT